MRNMDLQKHRNRRNRLSVNTPEKALLRKSGTELNFEETFINLIFLLIYTVPEGFDNL